MNSSSPTSSGLSFLKLGAKNKNNISQKNKEIIKEQKIDMNEKNKKYEIAKGLANINPDSLKTKTIEEIGELIKSVIEATQNSNEYLNLILDQKEQLKMDAEMHDKMIACLVQHAKQQQMTPKTKSRITPTLSNTFKASIKRGKSTSSSTKH